MKQNPDFRGRESLLKMIDQALLPENTTTLTSRPSVFILIGPGGIGKTQIALQYVHTRRKEFDVVLWVRANSRASLTTDFTKISLRLGLESKEGAIDPVVSRELVKGWLTDPFIDLTAHQGDQASWLLVLDNVDHPEDLHDFWPQDGRHSVLITSRDPLTRSDLYFGDRGAEVDTLPSDDAVALLQKLLPYKDQDEPDNTILKQIVKRLDCFPLAIVQMAGVMRRRRLTPAKFLDIYDRQLEHSEFYDLKVGSQHGYSLTLASIWSLENLSVGAAQLLSVISFLDPHLIPEEILTSKPERAKLEGYPTSGSAFARDLTELVQASIVRRNELFESNELSMHPLIQEVVRGQLLEQTCKFAAAFTGITGLLTGVWPYVTTPQIGYPAYDRVDRWNQCETMLRHIGQLRQIFERLPSEERKKCVTSDFLWLLAEVAW
jgi:hypothetical protein